jgi:hypothetical protein
MRSRAKAGRGLDDPSPRIRSRVAAESLDAGGSEAARDPGHGRSAGCGT